MWQRFSENSIAILVFSVLVIIIGLVIRWLLQRSFRTVTGENRLRGITNTGKTVFWFIETLAWITTAVSLVAVVFAEEGAAGAITTGTIEQWLMEHGLPIFIMLLVGFVLWFGMNRFLPPLITKLVYRPREGESLQGMKKRADTLVGVFLSLGKVILSIVILFEVLAELGVDIGPILAGFGIVGIAVGFGAQYLVRDLIAGVFILLENQYRVGDVVGIAGFTATVEEVNLRKTVLRDLDGIVHHIPNGEIKVASNYTRHFSRVKLDVPVSYNTDLEAAMTVINRVGRELAEDSNWRDKIISPPQAIWVNKFGDSGIDIRILGDCKPMEQWALAGELRLRLKKAFDREGIEIPWPHVKLYFGEPDSAGPVVCKTCSHRNLPGSKFCVNCGAVIHETNTRL